MFGAATILSCLVYHPISCSRLLRGQPTPLGPFLCSGRISLCMGKHAGLEVPPPQPNGSF
jgi:hypothetical protein